MSCGGGGGGGEGGGGGGTSQASSIPSSTGSVPTSGGSTSTGLSYDELKQEYEDAPEYQNQYGLALINASSAYARGATGEGVLIGIILTLFVATNFHDVISIRIAIGSATAFFVAQNLDINIFDKLRKKKWYVAPITSSIVGSVIDTFLFFLKELNPYLKRMSID